MAEKFYHKYKKQLEAAGYRVDDAGYVWDSRGNQSAGQDRFGGVQSKDPNVTSICRKAEEEMSKPKPKAKTKKKVEE
jgi:hypothetical protein